MATEMISMGPVTAMVQNQIYAAPSVPARLYTDIAATIQQSNTVAFTANTTVTLTEGGYLVTAPFIRVTSAGPVNVRFSRA
jgi:hypothetical protein